MSSNEVYLVSSSKKKEIAINRKNSKFSKFLFFIASVILFFIKSVKFIKRTNFRFCVHTYHQIFQYRLHLNTRRIGFQLGHNPLSAHSQGDVFDLD